MLLQPTTFFFLMLPEFPAVAVVPAFLSLVLVQFTSADGGAWRDRNRRSSRRVVPIARAGRLR